jgi:hypothetical protein
MLKAANIGRRFTVILDNHSIHSANIIHGSFALKNREPCSFEKLRQIPVFLDRKFDRDGNFRF